MTEKYFKITNAEENHHGFQYVNGLNVLKEPFQEKGSCVSGGLYFTEVTYIFDFLSFGIYLREISLPSDDPDFKMVEDSSKNNTTKWRANKIILGERRNLADVSTWEYLISLGANYDLHYSLEWASKNGFLDIIKFLTKEQIDYLEIYDFLILKKAITNGHLDVVEYMIKMGVDFKKNNFAIKKACEHGHIEIIKFLIKKGADFVGKHGEVLKKAFDYRDLDVIKLLIEAGADFGYDNNTAIKTASRIGRLDIVKLLVEVGINFRCDNDFPLAIASQNGHLEVVKFLVEKGADVSSLNNYANRFASKYEHFF